MRTRGWRIEGGEWKARSVLECGGPPPLFPISDVVCAAESARALAHSKTWRKLVALLAVFGVALGASAQGYSIDWYKVSGGGGTSTGGVNSVSGTIGQPEAGAAMSGGNYSLTGGFWALYAVQTPGAPYLSVALTPTNTVVVRWAVSGTSWQLQAATNLVTTGSSWTGRAYTTNGANCIYIESPPSGSRFYRLYKP